MWGHLRNLYITQKNTGQVYNCHLCKVDFHAKEALGIHLVGQHETTLEGYTADNPDFQKTRVLDRCGLCNKNAKNLSDHIEKGKCSVKCATMEFYFV